MKIIVISHVNMFSDSGKVFENLHNYSRKWFSMIFRIFHVDKLCSNLITQDDLTAFSNMKDLIMILIRLFVYFS